MIPDAESLQAIAAATGGALLQARNLQVHQDQDEKPPPVQAALLCSSAMGNFDPNFSSDLVAREVLSQSAVFLLYFIFTRCFIMAVLLTPSVFFVLN